MKPALLRVVSVTRETSLALTSLIPQVPLCQVHSVLTRFSRAPVGEIGSLRSAGPGWGTGGNAAHSPVTLSKQTFLRLGLQLEGQSCYCWVCPVLTGRGPHSANTGALKEAQIRLRSCSAWGWAQLDGGQNGSLEHPVLALGPWESRGLPGGGGPPSRRLVPASGLPRPRQGPAARRTAVPLASPAQATSAAAATP